jgi:hypothetical protein
MLQAFLTIHRLRFQTVLLCSQMDDLISIDKLVELAKKHGIDFGKGDPYNRLRYYTKIGWLPHMVRKKDESGNIRGHYNRWAVDRLIEIEKLKEEGVDNSEISKKLKVKTRLQTIFEVLKTKEMRIQLLRYASFVILLLILGNELGIIRLGKPKDQLTNPQYATIAEESPKQLIESGTAFIPKNQKKLFIQTPLVKNNYKVYVTFTGDYSPASRYWVSSIDDYKGFTVELDTPVFANTEFNWWVTN